MVPVKRTRGGAGTKKTPANGGGSRIREVDSQFIEKVFSWEENLRSLRIEPKAAPTPSRGRGAGTGTCWKSLEKLSTP